MRIFLSGTGFCRYFRLNYWQLSMLNMLYVGGKALWLTTEP